MKILSFNVAGLKSAIKWGFLDLIEFENPDIICLQEIKSRDIIYEIDLPEYKKYWNFAKKNGYSGVCILTKIKPISVKGFKKDDEGRIIIAEFEEYFIVNVYVPNSKEGLIRLKERLEWDTELRNYVSFLRKKVIVCGDFNVVKCGIKDIWSGIKSNKVPGCSDEERESFQKLLNKGFKDIFRLKYPKAKKYTFVSNFSKDKSKGWRIDYFLCNDENLIKDVKILEYSKMSDHKPIIALF